MWPKNSKLSIRFFCLCLLTFAVPSCSQNAGSSFPFQPDSNEEFYRNQFRVGLSGESYNPYLVDSSPAYSALGDTNFLQWPFGHLGELLEKRSPISKGHYKIGKETYLAIYLPSAKVESALKELGFESSLPSVFSADKNTIDFKYLEALGRIENRIALGKQGHVKNTNINYFADARFISCQKGDVLPLSWNSSILSGVLMRTAIIHESYFCSSIDTVSFDVHLPCLAKAVDGNVTVPMECYAGFKCNEKYLYSKKKNHPYFAYNFGNARNSRFTMIDLDGSGGFGSSAFLSNYGQIDGNFLHCPFRLCQAEQTNLTEGDLSLLSGGYFENEIADSIKEIYTLDECGPFQDGSYGRAKVANINVLELSAKTGIPFFS